MPSAEPRRRHGAMLARSGTEPLQSARRRGGAGTARGSRSARAPSSLRTSRLKGRRSRPADARPGRRRAPRAARPMSSEHRAASTGRACWQRRAAPAGPHARRARSRRGRARSRSSTRGSGPVQCSSMRSVRPLRDAQEARSSSSDPYPAAARVVAGQVGQSHRLDGVDRRAHRPQFAEPRSARERAGRSQRRKASVTRLRRAIQERRGTAARLDGSSSPVSATTPGTRPSPPRARSRCSISFAAQRGDLARLHLARASRARGSA